MTKENIVLRPISNLFQDSWKIFVKIWKEYLLFYVSMILGLFLLMTITFGYPLAKLVIENPNTKDITPEMIIAQWPFLILGVILFTLFASFISLAVGKLVYTKAADKDIAIKEALAYSSKHFLNYTGISLIAGFLVILGFILLVIPGIYALVALSLISIVFIVEENHTVSALKRSRELVAQNFWGVFGRLVLLFIVLGVISSLTQDVKFLQTILNFITGAITLAYIYLIYQDLAKNN